MAAQKRASDQPIAALEATRDGLSVPVVETAPPPNTGRKAMEGRVIRGSKGTCCLQICDFNMRRAVYSAGDIQIFERKNWLIHLHYIRKDFETCKVSWTESCGCQCLLSVGNHANVVVLYTCIIERVLL